MHPLCFALSSPASIGRHQRTVRILRPTPGRVYALAEKQPAVKSSFYKNPSKAIEKGGGFYIPGLRGPRLRVFVASVGLTLLSVNHLASIRSKYSALPPSFTLSEGIALFAVGCVAVSAFLDFRDTETSESAEDDAPREQSEVIVNRAGKLPDKLDVNREEVLEWTARAAMQMTDVDGFHVVDEMKLSFAWNSGERIVSNLDDCGEVVARVARENKTIYLDDTRKLPPGIDIPFLGMGSSEDSAGWAAYLVPLLGGKTVAVFSTAVEEGKQGGPLTVSDREWLKQCASRIEEEG